MQYLVSRSPSSRNLAAAKRTRCLNSLFAVRPNTESAPDVLTTAVSNLAAALLTRGILLLQGGRDKLTLLDKGWMCANQHI
jgi:hypothetical protein